MPAHNTPTHFGSVSKSLHWLTALLIAALFPLGFIAQNAPFATDAELAQKAWLFSLHKTVGVTLFTVALARILWALTQPKPALLHPDRKVESFVAELVHWLLYASLVVAPLSGWISHAASTGFAPIWWPLGQSLPMIPKSVTVAEFAGAAHGIFTKLLLISIALHIAGALKHHVIDRDATLRRMLPGRPDVSGIKMTTHPKLPILVAPVIFAAALGIGAALGMFTVTEPEIAPADMQTQDGNWIVEEGSLSLTVTQMGQNVTGSFANWAASITYDEATKTGEVQVEIDVATLTLGAVTAQAQGPEFLNASQFSKALFSAVLTEEDGQMVAIGTLFLKDVEAQQRLPFTLKIEGDQATVTGQMQIDRRDYAMGTSYPDESSVGFSVVVDVSLTARKN